MAFSTINPTTGDFIKKYQYHSLEQAEEVVLAAQRDFEVWRKTSYAMRAEVLLKIAELFRKHKMELADLMHLEMGKMISEAKAEIDKSISALEYYAKEGEGFLRSRPTPSGYLESYVSFQPLGVIFSIMPWNFPIWQVVRFAAPAIMAGNVVVLKHAEITTGVGEFIARVFAEIPGPRLLRTVIVDHAVAERIIGHRLVRGVTFTGSSRGGREVGRAAAENLKKSVLELGGSDAYIIFEDADVGYAAQICAKARLVNTGQSCVAGKRFIVHKNVAKEFCEKFVQEMKQSEIASLAAKKFQIQIIEQVEKLKKWGGRVLLGGTAPEGMGSFYPPSVILFEGEAPSHVHDEEVFGPVAMVFVARDESHALEIANASIYGLGGALFTAQVERGKALLEAEMQAGFVVINDQVKSDPRIPFGGVKDSGYGRELGPYGMMEFVNIKTVAVGRRG